MVSQHPHLIQTFMFHANIVGRIAAWRAGVPVVFSGVRVAEHQARWHLWLDRWTESRVDRYVCVSQSVSDFEVTHGGLPSEKMVVIPNGIDLAAYPAKQPLDLTTVGIPAGRRAVTFVGRLDVQKGVSWLIDTVPEWLERLPDCDLFVVGEGPLRSSLEATCRAMGIAQRVHFAGWRADIPEILAASSVLVLPSRWEGMPNVVLEAMASRLPVVASKAEGVVELLGPDTTQQTVYYGDTHEFAAKLVAILGDSTVASSIGNRNRKRAEENYSIARMVAAYEGLWEACAMPHAG